MYTVKLCQSRNMKIVHFLIFLIKSADIPGPIFCLSLLQVLTHTTEHIPLCVDVELLIPKDKAQRPKIQTLFQILQLYIMVHHWSCIRVNRPILS